MSDINRREFVTSAAAAAVSLYVLSGTTLAAPDTAPAPVDIGAKSDYAADGMTDRFIKTNHFVVIRNAGKIYASSSKCTHRNCELRLKDDTLFCHCHKSVFDQTGEPTKGPAKTALPRFAISADDKGELSVDTSKQFDDQHWDDPASFVKVDDSKK